MTINFLNLGYCIKLMCLLYIFLLFFKLFTVLRLFDYLLFERYNYINCKNMTLIID